MANILIADADPAIRQIISDTLRDCGHQLIFAEDSSKVQEALKKNLIHLLLADEDLAGAEMLEFLKEIKQHYPQTTVILMTGVGEDESEELLDAGAQAILSKPFNLEDFKRVVTEAIPHSLEMLTAIHPKEKAELPTVSIPLKKIFWRAFAILLLLLLSGSFYWYFKIWLQPIRIYSLPTSSISGMAHTGQSLWSCDWLNQTFYEHHLDALLSVKASFPLAKTKASSLEEYVPTTIAWDGKNLWSVSSWTKKMVRHDTKVQKFELELESPVKEASAVYFDGEFFWFCDSQEGKIVQVLLDGKSMKVVRTANSPGQRPIGIYKDKKYLWTMDARSGLIYQQEGEKNFKVIAVYSLPDQLQKEKISCFTSDGKNFWIGSESSQKIYQLHSRKLKLVSKSD